MYYARVISYLPYTISENKSVWFGKRGSDRKEEEGEGNLFLGWSKWGSPPAHHLSTPKWR